MQSIRTWHTYVGIFIAPSVLFFALTGAFQLFSLHEAHGGYTPPALIEKLGSLHKDQVFARKEHDAHEDESAAAHGPAAAREARHRSDESKDDDGPSLGTRLLKCFFLVVAVGLMASTLLGLWMGLTHLRHKRTGRMLLILGIVIPLGLSLI